MNLTLSIPEILSKILDAFKADTPVVSSFANDFTSDTAVLGDKTTAHIALLPATAAYDKDNGGFKNGATDASSLLEDVPVTLNQLQQVTVRIPWLTSIATKNMSLADAAIANMAFALGKFVVDQIFTTAVLGNVSSSFNTNAAAFNVDEVERLREVCNGQKLAASGRLLFVNTELAETLTADDRTKSKLFYDQRSGSEGFREFNKIGGFNTIREYQDFPIAASGLALDKRLAAVSVRKIKDMESAAKSMGIANRTMKFYPVKDEGSGLELTGVAWQEAGTGDVLLAVAILFGVHVGNGGGAAGSMTDYAGLVLRT